MFEDRTQNYDPEIHEDYMKHHSSCHIYSHVKTISCNVKVSVSIRIHNSASHPHFTR